MAKELYRGGVDTVDFADDEAFSTGLITITEFAREGNTWPDPEQITDALADDQDGPTAVDVPFEIRAVNMDTTDADALEQAGYDLARKYVRFTAKDGTVFVLKGVIPSVLTAPVAERAAYGVVKIAGKATGILPGDAYDVNPT